METIRRMNSVLRLCFALGLAIVCAVVPAAANAQTPAPKIGIVIMHGKGGSPTKYVGELAQALEGKGYLVANLEMPWSGKRDYDAGVAAADQEVETALAAMRGKGAQKVFVAGHSQGGLFALHFGDAHVVDGIIAIAPGGNVASPLVRNKLGDSVAQARQLIAAGKGEEKTRLQDFEFSKGTYPIVTTPKLYLDWFDPSGAMNEVKAAKTMNPATPVLYVAPTQDYPGLRRIKQLMFGSLPANPLTKLYEPDASHVEAPTASIDEIVAWTSAVAGAK